MFHIRLDDAWSIEVHRLEKASNAHKRHGVFLVRRRIHSDETLARDLESKIPTEAGVDGRRHRFATGYAVDIECPFTQCVQADVGRGR